MCDNRDKWGDRMDLRTTMGTMSGNPEQDVKAMYNYVFQLTEELRYLLNNLDVTNFNDLGLMRYENGRLQIYAEKLEVRAKELEAVFRDENGNLKTEIEATIDGIRTTVTANGDAISDLQGNIKNVSSSLTQTANAISAIVESVGVDGTVTAASIVAAINAAGSSVKISADRVDISGVVTIGDLKGEGEVVINAGNITAGEINAVDFVASGDLDGEVSRSFVIKDEYGTVIGNIGYQYVQSDKYLGDKLWIRTLSNGQYFPAVKVQAAGDVSVQSERSGGLVYIAAMEDGTVSLQAGTIAIWDGTSMWKFESGNLYKNGTQVL